MKYREYEVAFSPARLSRYKAAYGAIPYGSSGFNVSNGQSLHNAQPPIQPNQPINPNKSKNNPQE